MCLCFVFRRFLCWKLSLGLVIALGSMIGRELLFYTMEVWLFGKRFSIAALNNALYLRLYFD